MSYTYDITTDVGKVRALTRDTYGPETVFFQDAEIEFYLALNGGTGNYAIRYAAAELLDVWASDEAMVTKAIRLLDLTTNGPAVAASLREHARRLRALADEAEDEADTGFDIASPAYDPFTVREQVYNRSVSDG